MISSSNDIFGQWLSAEAQRVLAKIEADEPLTQDDKVIAGKEHTGLRGNFVQLRGAMTGV